MEKENYYITHVIVPEEFPKDGFDQLFYYTVKDKTLDDGKFYWGRGKNSFGKDFIQRLLDKNEIQKLDATNYPILIKEKESLFISNKGNIYKSSSFFPFIFKKKIGKLEIKTKK
jgi:hypothetical protein